MNNRLKKTLANKVYVDGLFIDCYNQSVSVIAGTILAGYNKRNLHYVMEQQFYNASSDGNCRTITTQYAKKGAKTILSPKMDKLTCVVDVINKTSDNNATTLTTAHHYSGNILNPKRGQKEMGVLCQDGKLFRIRKLTPRECFRLMGLSESEIDTIQSTNLSDTRQYCLAGNSIVVDVLEGIFRKMFVDKEITDLKLF